MASTILSRISRSGIALASRRLDLLRVSPNFIRRPESNWSMFEQRCDGFKHPSLMNAYVKRFIFSSSASSQSRSKEEANNPPNQNGMVDGSPENTAVSGSSKPSDASPPEDVVKESCGLESGDSQSHSNRRRRKAKRTNFSDSDEESQLSVEDLVKLVAEKEELLNKKQKDIEKMQDKVLRNYAEMENLIDRTKRDGENAKKFAIQGFAKSLLDVADNLNRASSVVKESFAKIDKSKDAAGAVPLLQTLLDGVGMTEKQLLEVFKKFGVEKFDPLNETFDPNRHYAVFQISDASKPPGTVAVVTKVGYMLHERVLRPAEVGVIEGSCEDDTDKKPAE